MKVRSVKQLYMTGVCVASEVILESSREDMDDLRVALRTVDRYKKKALRVLSWREKDADWSMVGYGVKSDAVVVTVKQGMIG